MLNPLCTEPSPQPPASVCEAHNGRLAMALLVFPHSLFMGSCLRTPGRDKDLGLCALSEGLSLLSWKLRGFLQSSLAPADVIWGQAKTELKRKQSRI